MALTCRNLTKIQYGNLLELVAGEEGLNNIILSSHVLEIIEYMDFVKKGDLIITLGYVLQNDKEKWKEFIYKLCEKESAGIIIDRERLENDTIEIIKNVCNQCDFPLFVMPVEMRMPNLQDSISAVIYEEGMKGMLAEKFFLEIMYSNMPVSLSKIKKAEKYGFDVSAKYCFIDVECKIDKNIKSMDFGEEKKIYRGLKGATYTIYDENVNEYIREKLNDCIKEYSDNYYIIVNGEKHTILLNSDNNRTEKILYRIKDTLSRQEILYRIGISCSFRGVENINKCYEQAVFARHRCDYNEEKYYENYGIDAIIHSSTDYELLKSIRDNFLGTILEINEEIKRVEMLRTLEEFIKHNCNYEDTAKVLYCHSNTVRNRISDIEKRLGIDHSSYNDIFNIRLALGINKKLEKMKRTL